MVHYLKEIPISEAVIKDFTYFELFLIAFNCCSASWVIICIYISSYFEFQCNNWKNKAGVFEYLIISLGGNFPEVFCPGTTITIHCI